MRVTGKIILRLIGVWVLGGLSAQASTIIQGPWFASLGGFNQTNISSNFFIPQFDPSLGTLTRVDITLNGYVQGSIAMENKSNSPAMLAGLLEAIITLQLPNFSTIEFVAATHHENHLYPAFDGTDDSGGTSGGTYTNLSGSASSTTSYLRPADSSQLSWFLGTSTLMLPVSASGQSTVTSPDTTNISREVQTFATADIAVWYYYNTLDPSSPVPEPSTAGLLGVALLGLGVLARKRRLQ